MYCSYIIERKDLARSGNTDWVQVFSRIPDTTFTMAGYNPEKDCLYRIRAENEYGVSEPSMSTTHYGRTSMQNKMFCVFLFSIMFLTRV